MNRNSDLLNGSIWKGLIVFAMPLAATSILQAFFNSADLVVVGQFASDSSNAIAAVGANSAVICLLLNLFIGLSSGTNVVLAGFIGGGNKKGCEKTIHTSILVSVICGAFLAVFGLIFAEKILILLDTPNEILALAALYFRIYFAGMPFIMLYNFVASIYRSKGDTRTPLVVLLIAGVLNVILNLFFVIICKMSVDGVAIATVISNAVSALILLFYMGRDRSELGFSFKKLAIDRAILKRIIKIGVPSGLQGCMFNIANIIIQSRMNLLGTACISGSTIASTYEGFAYYFCNAFGVACLTFVSQNYGAGDIKRCRQSVRNSMILGMAFCNAAVLIFVLFRYFWAGLYTTDPEAIKYAAIRMTISLSFTSLNTADEVLSNPMRVFGHPILPTLLICVTICGSRLALIFTWFKAAPSYELLGWLYPISWVLSNIAMFTGYFIVINKVQKRFNERTDPVQV